MTEFNTNWGIDKITDSRSEGTNSDCSKEPWYYIVHELCQTRRFHICSHRIKIVLLNTLLILNNWPTTSQDYKSRLHITAT